MCGIANNIINHEIPIDNRIFPESTLAKAEIFKVYYRD